MAWLMASEYIIVLFSTKDLSARVRYLIFLSFELYGVPNYLLSYSNTIVLQVQIKISLCLVLKVQQSLVD